MPSLLVAHIPHPCGRHRHHNLHHQEQIIGSRISSISSPAQPAIKNPELSAACLWQEEK